ncbi:MAG: thioredoxin family protein [Kiritimatiellia bacterium]
MNTFRRTALSVAAALTASRLLAAAIVPGAVNDDFAGSLAYAEAHNIPLAVVWGNTSCGHCTAMAEVVESQELADYLAGHPIVFVHKHEPYGSTNADYLQAKEWIKSIKSLTSFPFVGLMWQKANGERIEVAFSGLVGKMPATTPARDLGGQFVNSLAQTFAGFGAGESDSGDPDAGQEDDGTPAADASFVASGNEGDRLEATSATKVVYVPVRRTTATFAAVNNLAVVNSYSGDKTTVRVAWPAGVAERSVAVELPGRFAAGRYWKLDLLDAQGGVAASSRITMVADPGNSPLNPLWLGERTGSSLQYGEWTMDFDVAKAKVASQGGHLLAYFGGPLWCPNCQAIDEDVFDTREFRSWAKQRKVVLVLFEQGQASTPSTPQGTRNGRLLTCDLSRYGTSGAGYLSRKGIDPYGEAPQAVMDRVAELTARWLEPESTAARLGNPTLLLLDSAGERVQARFKRQNDGYTMDLQENLARLGDLIALEGADERDGYRTTTTKALVPGETAAAEFHVNRRTLVWRVDGARSEDYLSVCATSGDRNARDVTLSFLDASGQVLASGRNRLVMEKRTGEIDTAAIYLSATGFGDDAGTQFYGSGNAFAASVMLGESDDPAGAAVPFTSLGKNELKAANPLLYKRQTASVPVYATQADGAKTVAGVAAVSMSAANRLSVKLSANGTVSFSGVWQTINPVLGETSAQLTARSGENLYLTMDSAGRWSVRLDDGAAGMAWSLADAKPFAGRYTLALASADEAASGSYLTLNVGASGRFTASGYVGDGVRVSASGNLAGTADGAATAAIVKQSSAGRFAAALRIEPNAAATWGSTEAIGTVGLADDAAPCAWEPSAGETRRYGAYGGYWRRGATPATIATDFETPANFTLTADGLATVAVGVKGSGFAFERTALKSLSLSRSTGELSGKLELTVDGRKTTATIRGAATPGWYDCGCTAEPVEERPFAWGMAYWTLGRSRYAAGVQLDYAD